MKAALAVLLFLPWPALPAGAAPDEHFQGLGDILDSDCPSVAFLLTVDRVGGDWLATLNWPPCSYFLPFTAGGLVFRLHGDWAHGWFGTPIIARFGTYLRIGPYGDGTAIPVEACLVCILDDFYFYGRMADLGVL